MTPLTRRETLLVTAAAAVTAPLAAHAADPEPTYLLVPASPVTDGSAIPIGVSIPMKLLTDKVSLNKIKTVSVDFKDAGGSLAVFKLSPPTFSFLPNDQNLEFSTRIKVPFADGDGQTKKISLLVDISIEDSSPNKTPVKTGASADLQVNKSDCLDASVGLLRLSVQPPMFKAKSPVAVKAMVPQPLPAGARKLTDVSAKLKDQDALGIHINNGTKFADEFYLQFNAVPSAPGNIAATFTYSDGVTVSASIYVDQDKSAGG